MASDDEVVSIDIKHDDDDHDEEDHMSISDMAKDERFLDSVPGEIALFRAVTRARPVGIHRQFHMVSILHMVLKDTGYTATGEDVWRKLGEMYDLEALEDLEASDEDEEPPSPSQNLVVHPAFKQEFSLYNLPPEVDLEPILAQRRRRETASPESDPEPLPSARPRARIGIESTPKPKQDLVLETPPTPVVPVKRGRGRPPKNRPPIIPGVTPSQQPATPVTPVTPSTPAIPHAIIPNSTKKEVQTAGLATNDSDSSALTEEFDMEVDIKPLESGRQTPAETGGRRTRGSTAISTPRTAADEDEDVDVGSPAVSTASKPTEPKRRGPGRPPKKRQKAA